MPRRPVASSPPPMISPPGCGRWWAARFSLPTIKRRWLESPEPEDPGKPLGQKYGYGITQLTFGPNSLYSHGGEMPGYNSFMGYDPVNDVTLIVWTNLTISLDGRPTANSIMLKLLDRIYTVSPLQQSR